MARTLLTLALAASLPALSSAAWAGQSLVPSPYPSTSPGTTSLNPPTPSTGTTQAPIGSPYPQTTGAGSMGNPPTVGTGGGQQTVPSTFQEKYGVQRK